MRLVLRLAVTLTALCLAAPAAAQKDADYGDAPDGGAFAYPSKKSSNGARHTRPGRLVLGEKANRERDSKQVDEDRFDDGFHPQLAPCATSRVIFLVDASRLPKRLRRAGHNAYLNAWFDWTGDGDWRDTSRCGQQRVPEWRLRNLKLDMASFARRPVQAVAVEVLAGPDISALWARASVTLDKRFARAGRGLFREGETEDQVFRSEAGPPPDGDPDPDPPPPPDPDPRDIFPVCVSKGPTFFGSDLFLKHGEAGRMALLVWPPGRQATFQVEVPPNVARDLDITRLPDDVIEVRSRHVDGPRRAEGYRIRVIATSGQRAVAFECLVNVWHDHVTWFDEEGDFVPDPDDPPYRCVGNLLELFNNWNTAAVRNGGTPPTFDTGGKAYCVHQIANYHWNGRRGKVPGKIFLTGQGRELGPWQAVGGTGQGGARSVDWIAHVPTDPRPTVINGTYTCRDSDPATWSQNSASGGRGFCKVFVTQAEPVEENVPVRQR